MLTKDRYVLRRVKYYVKHYQDIGKLIDPMLLNSLIEQWSFDYDMEKMHSPEVLENE